MANIALSIASIGQSCGPLPLRRRRFSWMSSDRSSFERGFPRHSCRAGVEILDFALRGHKERLSCGFVGLSEISGPPNRTSIQRVAELKIPS